MSHLRTNVWKSPNAVTSCPKRHHDEVAPKEGLAYTPADMSRMHAAGMPVNSANLINSFCDGDKNPSFDLPFERKRGVDMAEIWEESVQAKKRINAFSKKVKNSSKKS